MNSKSKHGPAWAHCFMGSAIGGLIVHCYFYFTNSPKFNPTKVPVLIVMLAVSSWFVWRKRQKAKLDVSNSKTF